LPTQEHSGPRRKRGLPLTVGAIAALLVLAGAASPTASLSAPNARTAVAPGVTVLLAKQTKTAGCTLVALPDRQCSPGGYYKKLTKAVICSAGFRTSDYRHVPTAEKHQVEQEYGLAAKSYGSTLEIDHIVSLELGGSNDPANLFPEEANAHPGYHVKDKLENKLHQLVCAGTLNLRRTQRQIATNWISLYTKVFGSPPTG